MNTTEIYPRPESLQQVEATLQAQRRWLDDLRKLAAEFAAHDLRPIVFVDGELQPVRDFNIPAGLTTAIRDAYAEVSRLEFLRADLIRAHRYLVDKDRLNPEI